jgi:hypothetical protein
MGKFCANVLWRQKQFQVLTLSQHFDALASAKK